MKPQLDAQVAQFNAAKAQWDAAAASLPDSLQVTQPPGNVPKMSVTQSFANLSSQLEHVNGMDDIDPLMLNVHQPGIVANLNALGQGVSLYLQQKQPQQLQNIVSWLWGVESSLLWMTPTNAAENMAKRIGNKQFASQLRQVERLSRELIGKAGEINDAAASATKAKTDLEQVIESIKGNERESGTAKNNSQANAAQTTADRQAIADVLKQLTDAQAQETVLFKRISDLSTKADQTLEGASKVGLARAYADRRVALSKVQRAWAGVFVVSVLALMVIPHYVATSLIDVHVEGVAAPYISLLLHAIASAPLVWLAWYCAIQHRNTTQIMEDYAFKESAALSFVGYSREMSSDTTMIGKLQDSAVAIFGSNPARLLSKEKAVTPVHSLMESLLEKIDVNELVGSVNRFIDKSKVP